MMEFLLILAVVLGLLGALARLTVGYEINSLELIDGDRERPLPLWFPRTGSVR